MALKTIVKISGVTNLSDARYCAGMGVDMLGFSMDADSPHYVAPAKLAEMRSWVAGVQVVGETTATDPELIEQFVTEYQPDMLQVDEAALLPYLGSLFADRPGGLRLILRVDLAQMTLDQLNTLFLTSSAGADYILLESPEMLHFDPDMTATLQRLSARYPVLLGAGITAHNVLERLAEIPLQGIALSGGNEEQPGNRDFGALMDILEAIEIDG